MTPLQFTDSEGSDIIQSFLTTGIYISSHDSFENIDLIKQPFKQFIEKDIEYKSQYTTSKAFPNTSFDGFSYYGQNITECSNQSPIDLLHSFVLSDFSPIDSFPTEFHQLIQENWSNFISQIKSIEKCVCEALGIDVCNFYDTNIGHMLSANYYPPTSSFTIPSENTLRLTVHEDVSFITIFPFGIDKDFSHYNFETNTWVNIESKINKIVLFPGYLFQKYTHGRIRALQHRVLLPKNVGEVRFSFAFFSLPYPNRRFQYESSSHISQPPACAAFTASGDGPMTAAISITTDPGERTSTTLTTISTTVNKHTTAATATWYITHISNVDSTGNSTVATTGMRDVAIVKNALETTDWVTTEMYIKDYLALYL